MNKDFLNSFLDFINTLVPEINKQFDIMNNLKSDKYTLFKNIDKLASKHDLDIDFDSLNFYISIIKDDNKCRTDYYIALILSQVIAYNDYKLLYDSPIYLNIKSFKERFFTYHLSRLEPMSYTRIYLDMICDSICKSIHKEVFDVVNSISVCLSILDNEIFDNEFDRSVNDLYNGFIKEYSKDIKGIALKEDLLEIAKMITKTSLKISSNKESEDNFKVCIRINAAINYFNELLDKLSSITFKDDTKFYTLSNSRKYSAVNVKKSVKEFLESHYKDTDKDLIDECISYFS